MKYLVHYNYEGVDGFHALCPLGTTHQEIYVDLKTDAGAWKRAKRRENTLGRGGLSYIEAFGGSLYGEPSYLIIDGKSQRGV
jgi:hypothetical protein